MSLRWCTYTGAAMIIAVLTTYFLLPRDADPPGIKTRWWDGTLESEEQYHYDGKLFSRTIYGDDGKSVVKHEQWDPDGALRMSKVRLADGTLELHRYTPKGQVEQYQLRTGDDRLQLIERNYLADGKLSTEKLFSPDGSYMISYKRNFDNGQLRHSVTLTKTGEQTEEIYYRSGKLKKQSNQSINGQAKTTWFYEDGKVLRKDSVSREEGVLVETFDRNGQLDVRHVEKNDDPNVYRTMFKDGKVSHKQTWKVFSNNRFHRLDLVEEYNGKDKPVRSFEIEDDKVTSILYFREDGTRARRIHIKGSQVEREEEFDEKGDKVVKESKDGVIPAFDASMLRRENIEPPQEEELP